ncbi:hypothetical protein Hanom_Chr10g00907371 [Helianthus anomalus]
MSYVNIVLLELRLSLTKMTPSPPVQSLIITPFGSQVVPLVYMIVQTSLLLFDGSSYWS